MANKKMMENMKKHGVKSVAGILVAATLMSTAVPALAEPVQLGDGVETQASVEMDNVENDVAQGAGPVLLDDVAQGRNAEKPVRAHHDEPGQNEAAGQNDASQAGGTEEVSGVAESGQTNHNDVAGDKQEAQDNSASGTGTDAATNDTTNADEKTDAKADEKTDAKADEKTDAKADEKTDAKADEKTDAKADEKTDAKADEKTDAKADEKTDAKADEKTDAKADEKTDAKADEKTDAKADENKEQEAADANTKEIKKQVAADAAAEKKAKEDAEKAQKEAINKAGGVFAKLLIEASKKDYSDSDHVKESLAALGKKTLALINDSFLKDIPYGGGFIHEIIGALTGEEKVDKADITNQKLTEVIASINKLNSTVEMSTDRILDAQKKEIIDHKIGEINKMMGTFFTTFTKTTGDYDTAMKNMSSPNASAKRIQENMESVYNTNMDGAKIGNGTSYYEAYINYLNTIMDKQQVESYKNNNVFALYDEVAKSQSNFIGKYNAKRTELVNNVQSISDTGYIELKTAMGLDVVNCINSYNVYQQKISNLRQQILNCKDQAEINALNERYEEYKADMLDYEKRINTTVGNLVNLDSTYNEMVEMIKNQRTRIKDADAELTAFQDKIIKENKEVKTDGGNKCTEMDLKTGTILKGGNPVDVMVHVYPRMSADKTKIEYVDKNNDLIATQKINKEETVTNVYSIKKGEDITFIQKSFGDPNEKLPEGCTGEWEIFRDYFGSGTQAVYMVTKKVVVHIDKVEEVKASGFWNNVFNNTNHVITGTVKGSGETFKYVHGDNIGWKMIRNESLGKIELQ